MVIVDKTQCCGCRSCLQVCPKNAILIVNDEYGYENVIVDADKCINCDKCKKVCPTLNQNKNDSFYQCGSAYAIEDDIKHKGSSGGMFGVVAKYILGNGGLVYGAAFDSNLKLKTTCAKNDEELVRLFKSKYLLCDTSDSYASIKKDLDSGREVLYCSTPCQVSALKNFLEKPYDNLICIDFVCHGVGSQKQFDDSVRYEERRRNIKILDFGFREKFKSAASHHYYFYKYKDLSSGKQGLRRDIYMTFPYYYAYSDRLTCREVCYSCPYASRERVGDITIGDFHSINEYEPEIDRFAGVSMFICNTKKGNDLFEKIRPNLITKEYEHSVILRNNRFSGVEKPPKKRTEYLELLAGENYESVVNKLFSYRRDWRYYYYKMPRIIRMIGYKLFRR